MDETPAEYTLNTVDKITRFKFKKFCYRSSSTKQNINKTVPVSDDEFSSPKEIENTLEIEHSEYTDVDSVGLQVWDGTLLLADFVIYEGNSLFAHKNVLELSSGTGFVSIVVAMYCEHIICTDIKEANIFETIEKNFARNKHMMRATYSLKELNFLNDFSEDFQNLISKIDIILVSEVIYDDKITDGFVDTLVKLLTHRPQIIVYITMEKRYVFTIQNLRVEAKHYDYFFQRMNKITEKFGWKLEPLCLNFPRFFYEYERNKELELWRITTE